VEWDIKRTIRIPGGRYFQLGMSPFAIRSTFRHMMATSMLPGAAEIIETHQAGVWRYLRFLGCDEAQADDLT